MSGSEGGDSQNPSEQPDPEMDSPPEPGPGGPADRIEPDKDDFPLATPDQPLSAQVDEENVPDEIEETEDLDEGEDDTEPGDEPSS